MDLFMNIKGQNKAKLLKLLEANTFTFKENLTILNNIKSDNIIGIVLKGYLQIVQIDHNGNRTLIEELENNDVFGSYLSSLNNNEYELITKEESTVILIDYQHIVNYQENSKQYYNNFVKNLLMILMEKMQEKNERIEILTKKGIRNKLLEYFNIISKKRGTNTIYLPYTYSTLADYLAVDRSAMMREIKNLKEEGLIETKNGRIRLLYEKFN